MAAASADENYYHRRSDRGPEKDEYHHLPNQDQHLISQLRYAMTGARDKVTKLRDNIDDKDRDISRETALRKAAETRLEQLVDMYGDPMVMEELRDRLPRAGKEDVKEKWGKELDQMKSDASQSYVSPERKRSSKHNQDVESLDGDDLEGSHRRRRGGAAGEYDSEEEGYTHGGHRNRSHSPVRNRGKEGRSREGRRRDRGDDSGFASHQGQFGAFPAQPFGGYHPAMYPYPQMMYPPPMQASPPVPGAQGFVPPHMHSTPIHGQGGLGQPMATGYSQGSPSFVMSGPTGQLSHANAHHAQTGVAPSSSGGLATALIANNLDAAGNIPGHSSTPSGRITTKVGSSSAAVAAATDAKDDNVNREQNRQISLLLTELDASKDLNDKLQEQLSSAEKELQLLQITNQTKDAQVEADSTAKAADLVAEIYRAQKRRDEAMLGRLRIANEERDEALLKLKQKHTSIDEYEMETDSDDMNLRELLADIEVADSAGQINNQGSRIVDAINASKQRKRQITTEEMKAVLEERDNAVAKSKKVEGELLKLQRQTRSRTPEKEHMAAMQAKLLATQQERDMALTRVRKLEEELQTIKIYYSLHKSLSQEANLRDQFNNTLENIEGQLKQRDSVVDLAQKENNQLLSQLKQVVAEKELLTSDLEKARRAQKEANSNCEKMERLVNVLRRKINGLGSKSDGGETE